MPVWDDQQCGQNAVIAAQCPQRSDVSGERRGDVVYGYQKVMLVRQRAGSQSLSRSSHDGAIDVEDSVKNAAPRVLALSIDAAPGAEGREVATRKQPDGTFRERVWVASGEESPGSRALNLLGDAAPVGG